MADRNIRILAGFIPKKLRLELFSLVYSSCGSSPTVTANAIEINTRQVYFYLPGKSGRIRNYPDDETTAHILKAALKLAHSKTLNLLKQALRQFSRIIFSL